MNEHTGSSRGLLDHDAGFYQALVAAVDNNTVLRVRGVDGVYLPVSCSREFAEMMECTPEEFLAAERRDPLCTVHPDDRAAAYLLEHGSTPDGSAHVIIPQIMKHLLEMKQMQVEIAENGEIALGMFMDHPACYYDAVLMDARMLVMDGLDAAAAIRSLDKAVARSVPIIAMTANAFDEDVQSSLQAGMDAHLSKPVEPNLLFETLASYIHP